MTQQPSHAELAATLARLDERLDGIEAKLTPISDAYKAATLGAKLMTWGVGMLAGIAAFAEFVWPEHGK